MTSTSGMCVGNVTLCIYEAVELKRRDCVFVQFNVVYTVAATRVQWSLRIKDTLGAEILSFIWRLSSGGRFESL